MSVGIFDSGLGGLTAFSALRALLPEENIIYFADTGRNPYGTRPVSELRSMVVDNLEFLSSFGVDAILAACGTMSTNCGDILSAYRTPVFNVLNSSAERMAEVPGDGPLAVIATDASIRSGGFVRAIEKLSPGRRVDGIACQDFVRLIEQGRISPDDPELMEAVAGYLKPIKDSHPDAMLLACTHFGIIRSAINDYLGGDTEIISAAECAAKTLAKSILSSRKGREGGETVFYTSGSTDEFNVLAERILNASGCYNINAQRAGI